MGTETTIEAKRIATPAAGPAPAVAATRLTNSLKRDNEREDPGMPQSEALATGPGIGHRFGDMGLYPRTPADNFSPPGTDPRKGDVHTSPGNHPPSFEVTGNGLVGLLGKGKPLPEITRQWLDSELGQDVSNIEVHDNPLADHASRALGADALAVGRHVAFRKGYFNATTTAGRELLLHEARHVAFDSPGRELAGMQSVQLKVSIDDVTEEMKGMTFTLRSEQGSAPNLIARGTTVTVTDWKGTSSTAAVKAVVKGKEITLNVPKLALEPAYTAVKGVRKYETGLVAQETAVEESQTAVTTQTSEVAAWKAKKGQFQKKPEAWQAQMDVLEKELVRRQSVLDSKEKQLSRILVMQTMYNRFDADIAKWVDYYNKQFKPSTNLDPNVVKSMLFEESRMGTHGQHLELPPYSWSDPVRNQLRSRFNIGQAIDSWTMQHLLLIKEMSPTIFKKYHLDVLEKENKTKGKTQAEFTAWHGGDFGKAVIEFHAARGAGGENLMGTKGKDLYEDYGFWIRDAVRWLFYKYQSLSKPSWEEAVRAYNGSGPGAQGYRKSVMARVGSQKALFVGDK